MNQLTKEVIFKIAKHHQDIVILDTSFHLHRFAFVHKDLSVDYDNEIIPTGAFFGFTKMLCYLVKRLNNPAIIMAIDGYDLERKKLDAGYKEGRDNKLINLHDTVPNLLKLSSLIPNVYLVYDKDFEADDGIYVVSKTLDYWFSKNNINKNIYISSLDKDLYQCINDRIKLIKKWGSSRDPITNADIVDIQGVKDKFNGVYPEHLAKFRAITGDASDNLKGYYRFPKKHASVIANECKIHKGQLIPNDPIEFNAKNPKSQDYLDKINNEYHIFKKNYAIMKLKEFDFKLEIPDKGNAIELLNIYQLNVYRRELNALFGMDL